MLLIDVKVVFDYVSRNRLLSKIDVIGANEDLVWWRGSFVLQQRVGLAVNYNYCMTEEMEMEVSQRPLVSPILFLIYFSSMFKEMEKEVKRFMMTSFLEDCGWLVIADSVAKLCERLKKAKSKVPEWRGSIYFAFNNANDDMIVFTSRKKPYLKRRIVKARVTVHRHTMIFNMKTMRWLRVYFYTKLQFQAHKNHTLKIIITAESEVRRLTAMRASHDTGKKDSGYNTADRRGL